MCQVNIATGELSHVAVDFYLPGFIPLHWVRTYSSTASRSEGPMGFGWRHSATCELRAVDNGLEYSDEESRKILFPGDPRNGPVDSEAGGLKLDHIGAALRITEGEGRQLLFEPLWYASDHWRLAVDQDAYGNSIRYFADQAGALTGIIDSTGRRLSLAYDWRGRLVEVRLLSNHEGSRILTTYSYDGAGDLISAVDSSGAAFQYFYDDHLLVQVMDRIRGSLYCSYDEQRRCVYTWRTGGSMLRRLSLDAVKHAALVMDSRGFQTVYKNNEKGNTEQEIDPYGLVRQDVFNAAGDAVAITDKSGAVQQIALIRGRHLIVSSGSGATEFVLNELDQPIEVKAPNGGITLYQYDRGVNVSRIQAPDGGVWQFRYDPAGALVAVTDPRGHRTDLTQDGIRITSMRDDYGPIFRATFDEVGLTRSFEDALGRRTLLELDPSGQLVSIRYPDGGECFYTYDAEGNLQATRDETGNTTDYSYDPNGSPIEIREPGGATYRFTYDSEENLTSIINAKGERASFEYNGLNRGISVQYFDGRSELYDYDDRGNVVSVSDGEYRRLANLEYDSASRLVKRTFPDGTHIQIEYGAQNEVLAADNRSTSLEFKYDLQMQIAKVKSPRFTIDYEYDLVGNRTALRASGGRNILYEWDGRRRLTRMTDSGTFTYQYTYTETDFIREMILPSGVRIQYQYDVCGRMVESLVLARDGARVASRSYRYDLASRLMKVADSTSGSTEYIYDARERLIEVRRNSATIETYRYDEDHNLTLGRNGEAITIQTGDRVASAGETRFGYDDDGNVSTRISRSGRTSYSYAADGELTAVELPDGRRVQYEYDALGRRIAKYIDGLSTRYTWDGAAPLEEICATGSVQYLFMPGSFFPTGLTLGSRHYSYWLDQLGTPIALFDSDGAIVWSADSTAFGEIRAEHGSVPNPFRFQGQYFDSETGLHYNHHRYYDPALGRFLTPDPIGFNGGVNLYNYVPNPINWMDPFGLVVCDIQPKCSWGDKQQKDSKKKAEAMNEKLKTCAVPIPNKVPGACANRKNAKEIYDDCRKQGHPLPKLNETKSKCSNQQADHIIEVVAGGGETDCKNLQPLIETVNKSFGSQMAKCAKANPGKMLTGIRLLSMAQCRPGGKKCP